MLSQQTLMISPWECIPASFCCCYWEFMSHVCVFPVHPVRTPHNGIEIRKSCSRGFRYTAFSCGGTTEDLFWGPAFPPMRNVCNSKGLLTPPPASVYIRARERVFCFRAGELGLLCHFFFTFLNSFGVSPLKILDGTAYGLSW